MNCAHLILLHISNQNISFLKKKAPLHCKITNAKNEISLLTNYFIEQIDTNSDTKTFVNGHRIEPNVSIQLQHGNCIVIGGSHYFRFNNPVSKQGGSSVGDNIQIKDYQFAKNEIEQCHEKELMEKIKNENDLKLQELKDKYEKNIESMKIVYEREKNDRKLELELIKTQSNKKYKQIVHQKLVKI